jgi:hypothetical protein
MPWLLLSATAVGNADLPQAYRLARGVIAEIVALGWAPPGVVPGSGESFGLRVAKTEAAKLSRLITRTLRDIYGTPHPAFLTYTAHDASGQVAPLPALGVARALASIGDGVAEGRAPGPGVTGAPGGRTARVRAVPPRGSWGRPRR